LAESIRCHTQTFTYSKALGKILTSVDPNNQTMTSEYDGFGRSTHVFGPSNIYEEIYSYDVTTCPAKITSSTKISDGKYVKSFTFIDGLGRQILSRVEAEYKGVAKHIVSGEVKYDSRGQVIRKYVPYYIDVPIPDNTYIPPQNNTPSVRYEYDAMGRLIKIIRPDNKTSYTIYGINTIEAINENNQHMRQTKDAYGKIIEVKEDNGSVTNYAYDTLGNLTDTYDSASPRNHVQMQYDTLGRKTSMTDPDMGGFAGKCWRYYYDKAGNLTSQVDVKGQTISFQYDAINRLFYKSTGVTYTYDGPIQENRVGRLSQVTDSSGTTTFFYDILGREIKTTKTISTASYTIERTFDSVDRILAVKYPDNSVVTYTYNKQGGPATVVGAQSYVSSVDYNANGQIERINYGNGTHTEYAYDPNNFRLDELKTYSPQSSLIQILSYNFDPIGNVTSILDSVYTNTQHFQYDNMNRLTLATGTSYGQIDYAYNSIGNMLKKGNLDLTYGDGAGPHAVTKMVNRQSGKQTNMSYDYNGNMTQKGDISYEYDIENRLKKVITPKGGGTFDLSLNFTTGWNFFSLPGFIPNTSGNIIDILSPIEGKYDEVLTYDTTTDKWKHYVGNTKFNQFDKLEYGKGYLIYIKEPCTLNLTGSFPTTTQVSSLKTGWNLIVAPTNSEIEIVRALKGITYDSIAEYNGTGYTYNPTTLQKGHAYWVHVNTDQTWNIPLPEYVTSYTYDGDGGRVSRVADKEMTVYLGSSYELEGAPGQTPDKTTKHIFMGSTRICSIETTTATHTYYYHQDHIGSSNVITDETGAVVNILEYSPFGEVSRNTGDYSTDKRFTGKIYDETSALLYFGARYYDPELGRFTTADPTVSNPFNPQDFNRYSYCRNNPIIYIDPSGLKPVWWNPFSWFDDDGGGGIIATIVAIFVTVLAIMFTGGPGSPLIPVLVGEVFGAMGGAATAAITGGNIGKAMFSGTVAGGITGGILGTPGSAGSGGVLSLSKDVTIRTLGFPATDIAAKAALQSVITSGVGAGAAVTSKWVSSAINRENIASAYEQQINALRTDSLTRPDKIKVTVGSRYLADKSLNPGSFGAKHSFIGESNPWEMGPHGSGRLIGTSDTVGDLSNWGTHITTGRAISSGAISSVTVEVSASGLKEAMAIYGQAWGGQPYQAGNHNSNYAVRSVIYGAGGDVPDGLGYAPGFPDRP
jgi:RHS repeat-associated protein